jgi:hypothetical protein
MVKKLCTYVAAGTVCGRGATKKSSEAGRALCCVHELAVEKARR